MSCKKIRIYYYGDGINTNSSGKTRKNVEKKATINLPKKVINYGEENGYDDIDVTFYKDNLILKGGGEVLMDTDFNGGSNEYIEEIIRYEWLDEYGDVVESNGGYSSDDDDDNSSDDDSSSDMSASDKLAAVMYEAGAETKTKANFVAGVDGTTFQNDSFGYLVMLSGVSFYVDGVLYHNSHYRV